MAWSDKGRRPESSATTAVARRMFDCVTYPKAKTDRFQAGFVVTGAGKAKIKVVKI